MTATARQLPEPATDTLDPITVAYACAYCDALEIEVLSDAHDQAWRAQRHGEAAMIVKRLTQLKGAVPVRAVRPMSANFATHYTTW